MKKFALYNNLGYWLARLSNAMHTDFMSWLSKYGVSGPQWMVLNALYFKNAKTSSGIADYIGVDRAAVTRMVDQLVNLGMVDRVESKDDRRFSFLHLTDKGRSEMEKILHECEGKEEVFTHVLSASEKAELKRLLIKLLEAGGIKQSKLWKKF